MKCLCGCADCEPGLHDSGGKVSSESVGPGVSKEEQRVKELKEMKNNYGIGGGIDDNTWRD